MKIGENLILTFLCFNFLQRIVEMENGSAQMVTAFICRPIVMDDSIAAIIPMNVTAVSIGK